MDRPPSRGSDFGPERRILKAEMEAEKSKRIRRNQRLVKLKDDFEKDDKSMTEFMNKLKEYPEGAKEAFNEIEKNMER